MVDVNSLKKWLKMEDLSEGDNVKITGSGEIREFEFEDKNSKEKKKGSALAILVVVNSGFEKELTLNNFSINELKLKYGSNTEKWVGKECIVGVAKTMSFGKIVDRNYLKPIQWEENA